MKSNHELDDRKMKILQTIIKTYLETGRSGWFQNNFQIHRFEFKLSDYSQ